MRKIPALIVLLSLLAVGCDPYQCSTPFGEGGQIDLSLPEFSPLLHPGGAVTINRGHKGIFVTRVSYSDFVAFDCACPNDNEVALRPDEEWGNSVLTCPTCQSRFNALDGTPLDGSATPCMLYQYGTSFDGHFLDIYP